MLVKRLHESIVSSYHNYYQYIITRSIHLIFNIVSDFETICDQGVPPPWIEDHGIYAIMVSFTLSSSAINGPQ